MYSEHVGVAVADSIMTVTLQRPEKKNALTAEMYSALAAALQEAEGRDDVRVVLLQGSPDCFSAGADLEGFRSRAEPGTERVSPGTPFIANLRALQKPVVAAVNGIAVGVGTTLLLHCDFVYAGESARFWTPFTDLGLSPEAGSSVLLPLLVGQRRAMDVLLLGDRLTAADAHVCGLINGVFADAEVQARARDVALQLAAKPASAVRQTKRLLRELWDDEIPRAMQRERAVFEELLRSDESKAARAALQARRNPTGTAG